MTEWIAIVGGGSFVLLALCAPWTTLNRYIITLGSEKRELDQLIRFALLKQHRAAFALVIAGGITAGLLAVACVIIMLFVPRATEADKVLSLMCAIGDSALFRYYMQVWRESGQALRGPG
jgi:hypothetical protein